MEDSEPILNLPRFRKARTVIWRDISLPETDRLLRLTDCEAIKECLHESFQIADDPYGRHLILVDTFYYAVLFCQKNSFNSEKTSCFLSIIKQTHELVSETPFGNLGECLKFFKDLVLCHSVHRPPFSLGIFSPQEASAISNYFIDTYLRHFKLYKYAFTPQVQLDLSIEYIKIPKTSQELDDEKKSLHEELTPSARSEGDALVEVDSTEGDPQQFGGAADAAIFDPKSASLKELKRVVRERLSAEMQELKASFSNQVKLSDEALGKLVAPASAPPPAVEADGKKSASSAKKNPKK